MEENKELPKFIFKFGSGIDEENQNKIKEKLSNVFEGSAVFFVDNQFEMLQLNDIYKKII